MQFRNLRDNVLLRYDLLFINGVQRICEAHVTWIKLQYFSTMPSIHSSCSLQFKTLAEFGSMEGRKRHK